MIIQTNLFYDMCKIIIVLINSFDSHIRQTREKNLRYNNIMTSSLVCFCGFTHVHVGLL